MSTEGPRLTVISTGPLKGRSYPLRRGDLVVGRGDEADVVIASPGLSRRHARVTWDGRAAWVADAGSRNGTTVNGAAIGARRALAPGDVLGLGGVELRFDGARARSEDTEPVGMRWDNAFGRDNYGAINQAARDVNVTNWNIDRDDDEAVDELFQGRGFGRVLVLVGSIVALAGFAGWMYVIFSGFGNDDPSFDAFAMKLLGAPLAAVAFAAFAGGGIVSAIGASMSKAARARASRRDAFSDMRFDRSG